MVHDAPTILAAAPFFAQVKGPALVRLQQIAVLKQYAAGTTIFRQGQACPGVFVVGGGLVRIYKSAPNGKEHVLHLVSPGGTFAEVAAIGGFPCPAFAEALEETRCALLPQAAFVRALQDDHGLCLGLLGSMAGWVKRMVGLVEDIALRDAAGRVARYLLTVADVRTGAVELPSLKRHLASHLNLTSETLSRTLRRLADAGMVEDGAAGLVVRDRAGLEALAEGLGPLI
jgi:CRP/FNR family transcriptional regulator